MYSSRLIRVLFLALSFALVAKAIQPDLHRPAPTGTAVAKRQLIDIGDDDDETTTSEPKPTPTEDDKDTTTEEEKTTTSEKETTTDKPTSTSSSDKETPTDDKSETSDDASSAKTDDKSSRTPTTSTRTTVITTTNADGQPTSFTSEDAVVQTPGLNDDEDGGGSEGMSKETRNIVIGVVVGVGGAIVIGALAFVVFRIRNRKRAAEAPDHYATMEPMDKPDSAHAPSGSMGMGGPARNPFQSTLETYHAPTHVNASSNF